MLLNKNQKSIYKEIEKSVEIFLYGGAGSGKTTLILVKILKDASNFNNSRHLIVRSSFQDMKNSIIDTLSELLIKLKIKTKTIKSNPTLFILKNGSKIILTGIKEHNVDKILGNEYFNIYINEASEISFEIFEVLKTRLSQRLKGDEKNQIFLDCNPSSKKHWTYKYFIEENQNNALVRKMNPSENEHISNNFLNTLKTLSPEKQRRFLYGEFSDEDGDIFLLSHFVFKNKVHFDLKILSIDPAVSFSEKSDETGIILIGLLDDEYYIIDDFSGRFEVSKWVKLVHSLVNELKIDFIVIERNQGGDLIETLLLKEGNLNLKTVFNKNSKYTRAIYLKTIYENKKIFHTKPLIKLEEQILNFTGLNNGHDDRIDALMHGIIYLEQLKRKDKKIKII